jgi:hypothetical protein
VHQSPQNFAAIKTDGSIKAWGASDSGGSGAPSTGVYTKIYSNIYAFAALKADGREAKAPISPSYETQKYHLQ